MKPMWYTNKWIIVLMHSAAWVLLFSLPFLLRPTYNPNETAHPQPANDQANFIISRINDGVLICFFYLNALVLIPRIFYKKKYMEYCLVILLCFAFFVGQGWLLRTNFNPDRFFTFRKHIFFSVFIFMFILACSIAYRTIRDKIISDQLAKEKENEFLKTELSLLRSQVSPHFMFNVLNNMVALARKQSDQLEPSLIKLSSLMRYMLYETGEEKVSLEKETEYLQSYIDLQQQRFGKKVIIHTSMLPGDKMYFIEPMLLIPFVENAFKHGTGMIDHAQINISLAAEKNNLLFEVQNKYNPTSEEIKDTASGIGLSNVQRRLELLYNGQHSLLIRKNDHLFTITLQIHLS
ncbi:MAG: signal transduction histidine kinase, LytS [Ferruginibacter sp.]|nr:signal transduction histidine kinase, LytS [Ferruginibacter sp.]